jgi:hypothetical protein
MNKTTDSKQRSESIAEREDQNAERKEQSPLSRKEARVEGAIKAVEASVGILLIVAAVVGVTDLASKLAITLWLSGVAVVLILLGVALHFKKKAYERESAPIQRPELFIEEAEITPLIVGKSQIVRLLLRNRGDLPARNIKIGPSNNSLRPKDFAGPLVYGPGESDTTQDLAAGAQTVVAIEVLLEITEERFEQLNSGELLYFTYGRGSYEDDAGRIYPLEFCFMYSPMSRTILRLCPSRYWPKNDHEN